MLISPLLASLVVFADGASVPAALAVRLETGLADCPAPEEMRAALHQALGEGSQSAPGWVLRYDRDLPGPASTEPSIAVTLVAPAGEHLVERRIVVGQGDCPAVAGAIAAVVERSLRAVGWTRGDPLPVLAPTPVPTRTVAAAVSVRPPRLVVGLGPALTLASAGSDQVGGNLMLQARARTWGPVCVRVGAGFFSTSDDRKLGNVASHLTTRFASVAALAAFVRGRTELAAGPGARLGFDSATSSLGGSGDRFTAALGLATAIAVRL